MMSHDYDVLILGGGWAGTILASILARHGTKVCILEASSHPRYAIGESTIPQTSQMMSLIARQYDVKELEYLGLGSPKSIQRHITSACGIKRVFGFAYHRLGKQHDPNEAHQFGNAFRDENHLFRQDIDAYLAQVAVRHGATLKLETKVEDLDIDDSGVTVLTNRGVVTAQYLVDGAGYRSPVARKFGLREDPCRFAHHSRSIFTHMLDVEPFENVATNLCSIGWSSGTLHHCFDGGWLWVIPFNNHEGSTNALVSVGLTVDNRKYPKRKGLTPEEEFRGFVCENLPSAAPQFENARAMQPWVSTERLQFSSKNSVGTRFCLLSHASGFLDALYSRGLINSIEIVRCLGESLIRASRDGDYSDARFAHLEERHRQLLSFNDRIVNASYISWSDFDVWDCTVRIWAMAVGVIESNLGSYLIMGESADYERASRPLVSEFEHAGFRGFFEECEPYILAFQRRELTAATATTELRRIIGNYDFRMKLPDRSRCAEWALKNPGTRDWFIGSPASRARWEARESDPHLMARSESLPVGLGMNARTSETKALA